MASYQSLSDDQLWQDIKDLLDELEDDAFPSDREKKTILILEELLDLLLDAQ